MPKLIVANWKNNPKSLHEAARLAKATDFKGIAVAPPRIYLSSVAKLLKNASLARQNLEDDIPPKKLKIKYVILGHSDYRKAGETDAAINKKIKLALKHNFKVILCVGESKAIRRKGIPAAKRFITTQLQKDLAGIRNSKLKIQNLAIAYEPIWAISTEKNAKPDTPENAAQMIKHIKKVLYTKYMIRNTKVLYGGSVTPKNAKAFLSRKEIDGALVGRASLKPKLFQAIIKG